MLLPLMAQNNTNSPYTRFGYGDLGESFISWENVRSAQVEPWAVLVTDYVRRNK